MRRLKLIMEGTHKLIKHFLSPTTSKRRCKWSLSNSSRIWKPERNTLHFLSKMRTCPKACETTQTSCYNRSRTVNGGIVQSKVVTLGCLIGISKLYKGSLPYPHFGTWKKPCFMKFVLVGLY